MRIGNLRIIIAAVLVLVTIGLTHRTAVAQTTIFVANDQHKTIESFNTSGKKILVSGVQDVLDVEYDPFTDMIYFAEFIGHDVGSVIKKVNADGTGIVETIVPVAGPLAPQTRPTMIAIYDHPISGVRKLCWTDVVKVIIACGNLDVSGNVDDTSIQTVVDVKALQPGGLCGLPKYEFCQVWGLDFGDSLDFGGVELPLFWTDYFVAGDVHVKKSPFSPPSSITRIFSGMTTARGIVFFEDRICVAEGNFGSKITCANADGSM